MLDRKRLDSDFDVLVAERAHTPESRDFPSWHFAMLNDKARNAAIEQAIASLDLAGKTVFEIGSGVGLVALLFAKYGAARVFSCESNKNLADVARSVVAASPFADRVNIVGAPSSDVIDSGILPQSIDVIFTETVDCGVVGEGFFDIRRDIQRVAGAETLVLPATIEQVGCVIASSQIVGLNRVETICGFDLSALNVFSSRTYFPVRSALYNFELITRPQTVRTYSYLDACSPRECDLVVERDGTADGLLTWLKLDFAGHAVSNSLELASHWHQAYHPLERPVVLKTGDTPRLHLGDAGNARVE